MKYFDENGNDVTDEVYEHIEKNVALEKTMRELVERVKKLERAQLPLKKRLRLWVTGK